MTRTCTDCGEPHTVGRGLCRRHYGMRHHAGTLPPKPEGRLFNDKRCQNCGLVFLPTGPHRKFCSACNVCLVDGCGAPKRANGYCAFHNVRAKHGVPLTAPRVVRDPDRGCKIDGCDGRFEYNGYCAFHARRAWSGKPLDDPKCDGKRGCKTTDCAGVHFGNGYCKSCCDREYRNNHPEACSTFRARRRERLRRGLTDADIKMSVWARRDMKGEPCWYCNRPWHRSFHVDHAIPLAKGGTDDWTNLVSACGPCNQRKYTKTEQEFIALLKSERAEPQRSS